MKLADFRGAAVPVCVYDYAPVLAEIFTDGHEGATFRTASELASLFLSLAPADLTAAPALAVSRAWLAANPARRWEDEWKEKAQAVMTGVRNDCS